MSKKIKVIELFAGVGGFRLGLEGWKGNSSSSQYKEALKSNFKVVWSNQWEPKTKLQHASSVYIKNWGYTNHSCIDIAEVDIDKIPEHDLLVGGFPCQDYSVATSLVNSKGLEGKKGVLWWNIHKIISERKSITKYLLLENVDRLLISPSKQRGRDFAIILQSLNQLGYAVEWRVINSAEYGMPQRRKRIYIIAYHKSTNIYNLLSNSNAIEWIIKDGIFANAFPVKVIQTYQKTDFNIDEDLVSLSKEFNQQNNKGIFENSGMLINGKVVSIKTIPEYNGEYTKLKDVIIAEEVENQFYISNEELKKWEYFKGAKKEERFHSDGFRYYYSEGSMTFPDDLDKPSRTIITGEGGASPSRFKHVIETSFGLRRLTPVELERLNMFPDNHTFSEGIMETKRAFFMGNALVVGVVEKIGLTLQKFI